MQLLWYKGRTYETQEIFGISGLASAEDGDTGRECVICMTNERNTAILPCRHLCICSECAQVMMQSTATAASKCPICRRDAQSILKINVNKAEVQDHQKANQQQDAGMAFR